MSDFQSRLFRNIILGVLFSCAVVAQRARGDSWATGATLPSVVIRATGVFFPPNGCFYAMGGRTSDSAGSDLTHPYEYNPATNTWTVKSATYPDIYVSNMACAVLTDTDGTPYIYCVGGSPGGQTVATNRVFRYDPITDSVSSISAPWPGDMVGTILPGGFSVVKNNLYILGGFDINVTATNSIWQFTPGSNTWVQKSASLPTTQMFVPTTTIGGLIYTGGGTDYQGGTLIDTTNSYIYNPDSDTIAALPSIPRATGETRAFSLGGEMWVLGGGRVAPNPSNEVDIYNPNTNTWRLGPAFSTPRRNFPAAANGSRIWIGGGYASDNVTPLDSMEIFHSTSGNTLFDFNRDGLSDFLLVNPNTRFTALWYMRNNVRLGSRFGPTPPGGWTVVSVADFDQDGGPDYLLFKPSTRQTAVWYLNNNAFRGGVFGPTLPAGWHVVSATDVNGDGKVDYILFNSTTFQTAIWFLDGVSFSSGAYGPKLPAGWGLVGTLDFNADGKPDFVLFKPSTRQTAVWYLNGTTFAGGAFGPTLPAGWTLKGASQFNIDTKPDFLLFEPTTRQTAIWFLNGTMFTGGVFGPTLPSGYTLVGP
jgi:FG-GAP-like repeat/Kelch motif/Galactose oxidase, central domain